MDEPLLALTPGTGETVRLADLSVGEIEVVPPAGGGPPVRHVLRPLADLYGTGTGKPSIDPVADAVFLPLLQTIEQTVVDVYRAEPRLTDGAVLAALDRLCMTPEADVSDRLARAIQVGLRLSLSLNDYSRQDVRLALKKVRQSVNRHNRGGGPVGYLTFIREQLSR